MGFFDRLFGAAGPDTARMAQEGDVTGLVAALVNSDAAVRASAAAALGALADAKQEIPTQDGLFMHTCYRFVDQLTEPAVTAALVGVAGDADSAPRAAAIAALGRVSMIGRMNAGVSAATLGRSLRNEEEGTTGADNPLGIALQSVGLHLMGQGGDCPGDRDVVVANARSLNIGGPTATATIAVRATDENLPAADVVEVIVGALNDSVPEVRIAAAEALTTVLSVGDVAHRERGIDRMRELAKQDPDAGVVAAMESALRAIEPPKPGST